MGRATFGSLAIMIFSYWKYMTFKGLESDVFTSNAGDTSAQQIAE
jgi:hypothetical protein